MAKKPTAKKAAVRKVLKRDFASLHRKISRAA